MYKFQNSEEKLKILAELTMQLPDKKKAKRKAQVAGIIITCFMFALVAFLIATGAAMCCIIFIAALGILTILFACMEEKIMTKLLLKNMLKSDTDYVHGHGTWTFSDEGIAADSTLGKGVIPWTSISEYGEYKDYIFACRKDRQVYLVDKRELPKGKQSELMELLKKNVEKQ